ncbi:probable inactive ATP-dependent zinc metalloprotease FTSHI 1, chloroplastic isoform X2 [Vitis riparia]|uniref:probable inactive ATP-dependent zinc metalloprotease FTSHI 1, chloroplastic isoform X2 n=1 Tax=Vitis riparia TaxID=96939 RepID=UPI00155AF1C1|nr:probable inactive ATP-dependent zinc metalloprotease FTSHI 1, chloroplastic isoform X2 [Vitis riparia]
MLLQTTPFHPHPHLHIRKRFHFPRNPSVPLRISASQNGDKEDFITRVLKQNPSQVEPKFLIGQTLYTQKQKDEAFNKSRQNRWNWLRLKLRKGEKNGVLENEEVGSEAVFLKDILREHKGKLYVPEQIFGTRLSEEEEFDRDLESLPVMSLEEFRKAVENDKVKVVISKDESYGFGNFIVELKEIPGDKSLQRTKWAMKLDEDQAYEAMAGYTGPRYEIERTTKDIWQGIEFSQSKAQARVDGSTGVKFSDVAGIEEAVEELQELVRYLKNPELFDKMGIKPPHGVLLEGPPGCGKTLVAKAIAGEAGVPFYQMAGSEFVEVLVGVGSARIRDLFKRAKVNKPSVIFIDEIDALATRRQGIFSESTDHLYNAATQERETTLNQLLIELDGFDTGKGVIFLGATNRMDLLDPALLRPGRFDRKIRIRPPNAKGRLDILKVHARKVKLAESVDLSTYAQNLPGWTGARLAQLLQEAALVAVRKGHEAILQSDVDEAVDRLTVGPKRVGIELGHQGQCRRATTEVGTAITSHLLRRYESAKVERCDRISVIPRGQTLSQVVFDRLDDESYMFERRPQLLHRLQVLLGGRAAEEVIYGRDTSRASVDYLADASWLARKILTIWNLENPMVIHGEPPPWRKKVKFVGPRLDFEGSLYDDYGLIEPPVNFNLDDQVAQRTEELISDMYGKTLTLLRRHHAALLKTVKVLVEQKEISGEEIDFILNNYPPQTPVSCLLEEENPGSLPFGRQEQMLKLEDTLLTPSKGFL